LATIGEKADRKELLEQDYAVAGKLADLVGGQNPKRMTLQRYVLAALFEEVALAASQRLSRMSRGRYHLVRSEAPRDGKSTSGLDLDVTDDHTGEKRPAFTLSGGESFLASLSLALGLSDVVMAQCGGRYLDCIFIDEGFGSLDGETLDYALNTLIELHRSGRVIGIISHVAELRERITSQIEVVPSKEGSTVICSL
jgi:exonuclease SbcC